MQWAGVWGKYVQDYMYPLLKRGGRYACEPRVWGCHVLFPSFILNPSFFVSFVEVRRPELVMFLLALYWISPYFYSSYSIPVGFGIGLRSFWVIIGTFLYQCSYGMIKEKGIFKLLFALGFDF